MEQVTQLMWQIKTFTIMYEKYKLVEAGVMEVVKHDVHRSGLSAFDFRWDRLC